MVTIDYINEPLLFRNQHVRQSVYSCCIGGTSLISWDCVVPPIALMGCHCRGGRFCQATTPNKEGHTSPILVYISKSLPLTSFLLHHCYPPHFGFVAADPYDGLSKELDFSSI